MVPVSMRWYVCMVHRDYSITSEYNIPSRQHCTEIGVDGVCASRIRYRFNQICARIRWEVRSKCRWSNQYKRWFVC
jgi:hypothetical protein